MADYHPLIARAVDGLGTSTGEARRSLYERARSALVAQLRGIEPALSEADITRERLALEDAIRKVEAEAVRKQRSEARPAAPPPRPNPAGARPQLPPAPPRRERPSPPPAGEMPAMGRAEMTRPEPPRIEPAPFGDGNELAPDDAAQPAAQPSARSRLLNARTSPVSREGLTPISRDGLKGFRDVVNEVDDLGTASAKSAQSARDTRDSYAAASPQFFDDDEPPQGRVEPPFNPEQSNFLDDDAPTRTLEPFNEADEEHPPQIARPRPRDAEEHFAEPRPPRSYRGLAQLAVVLIVLAGLVATVSWQWSNINGVYHFFTHMRSRQAQTTPGPTAEPKFSGRVPQEQNGQAPSAGAQTQAGPAVAQRVVLYEEDSNDPNGKRYVGSAVWKTDTVSPGTGLAPELEVRADLTIPERNMSVTFTLRRNTDQALPASHTIEIMFTLPPDFAGGSIANVPGVLMKESEQARGVPLSGLAVKVTNGFFLIGLSAVDADVQRNTQLLKDRPWFDIPIVYSNGGRAILAMEKGPPGDRAFADAFAAWSK
ncbi:MAG: hypothetical protein ABSE22_10890 [Xanthobacteraceae bacterium]|jgi:hypothetical protein